MPSLLPRRREYGYPFYWVVDVVVAAPGSTKANMSTASGLRRCRHGQHAVQQVLDADAVIGGIDVSWTASQRARTVQMTVVQELQAEHQRQLEQAHRERARHSRAALGFAAKYGHADVVKAPLDLSAERGVDASASENDALYFAASNGHAGVIELLLADRAIALAEVEAMTELDELAPAIAELLKAHVSNYS